MAGIEKNKMLEIESCIEINSFPLDCFLIRFKKKISKPKIASSINHVSLFKQMEPSISTMRLNFFFIFFFIVILYDIFDLPNFEQL